MKLGMKKMAKNKSATDDLAAMIDQLGASPVGGEMVQELPVPKEPMPKKLKTPREAHGAEIKAMGYRKKTAAPTMAGGRGRASDIKLGSRFRGAY